MLGVKRHNNTASRLGGLSIGYLQRLSVGYVCLSVDGSNGSARDRLDDKTRRNVIEQWLGANTSAYQLRRRRQYQRRGDVWRPRCYQRYYVPRGCDTAVEHATQGSETDWYKSLTLLFVIYDDHEGL